MPYFWEKNSTSHTISSHYFWQKKTSKPLALGEKNFNFSQIKPPMHILAIISGRKKPSFLGEFLANITSYTLSSQYFCHTNLQKLFCYLSPVTVLQVATLQKVGHERRRCTETLKCGVHEARVTEISQPCQSKSLEK